LRIHFERWWPLYAMAAVAFLFFWNYFLLDETLFAGDTAFVLLPFRYYTSHFLQQGLLPLWNPHLFGGTPALAEAQYQVFYPPNLLLLLVGVARGHGWLLAFHLVWMALGTYLFARRSFGLDKPSSLLAAIVFAFGGCIQSRLAVGVFTEAAAWMPWLFLWYDAARKNPAKWWLPALAFCMQMLTGAPQYAYYSLALLFGYHLLRSFERDASTHKTRSWTLFFIIPVAGVLLGAAQILPQWELAGYSDRSTRASYEYATAFSLSPQHWWTTTALPKFYSLFSSSTTDGFFPGEETGYIGIVALILIGVALGAAFSRRDANTRIVVFWAIAAAISLFFAFGSYNPLYPLAFKYLPGIAMFRAPARWLLVTGFCGAMLAAFGLQALRHQSEARRSALVGGAVTVLICLLIILPKFGSTQTNVFNVWWALLALLISVAFCAVLLRPNLALRRFATMGVLALAVADLWWLSRDMEMQQTLPVAAVERPSPTAQLLSQSSDGAPPRFWPDKLQVPLEAWQMKDSSTPPADFRNQSAMLMQALMPSCVAAQYQTPGLTGAWGALMPLRRHAKPIYEPSTPLETQQRWLRLLGARHYLAVRPLERAGLTLKTSDPIYVFEDSQAMPRAWWVGNAKSVGAENAMAAVTDIGFNPQRSVIVENNALVNPAATTFVPARFIEYSDRRVVADINAPSPGYFVLMDSVYPGWRAEVDGREASIEPANWVGRGINVEAGTHRVQMHFEPQSLRVGLFISLAMLALISAIVVASRTTTSEKTHVSRR
jgi:hypothetical protein